MKYIGKPTHKVKVPEEFNRLATEDEKVSILLKDHENFKHAIYFMIQAMEKYVKSTIFSLVNPNNKYFRDETKNHSLQDALDLLINIVGTNDTVKAQIKEQLYNHVLGGIQFGQLHNDLRYPWYSNKYDGYSTLNVSRSDAENIFSRLNMLKSFLKDIHKIIR